MTLLVISPDYASHALPLITLAGAWQAAGERVVVATGPAVAPLVEESGMDFVELALGRGSNPGVVRPEGQPAGEDTNLRAFFSATRRGMVATLRYQAEARAGDLLWQPVQTAQQTLEIVDALKPDEILVDHLAFGATLGLRAEGIPYVDAVLGHPRQLPVAGETYGVPGAWPAAIEVDAQELASLRTLARSVARGFTDDYNAALQTLSASAAPVGDAFGAHGSLVLLNYPRELHDPRRTSELPAAHAFLGATPRTEPLSAQLTDWLEQDAQRPLVLVSLGTFLSAREDVLTVISQGLRRLDARVALATGSSDPDRLGPLPADWLVGPYLPQVGLLERASALVTHAGNNSVTEAVAAAVPMLALPFSTDQFDGAAAIEAAGLGLAADPNRVGPGEVAEAVRQLVGSAHPALDRLAAEVAARPAPDVARALSREWLRAATAPVSQGEGQSAQTLGHTACLARDLWPYSVTQAREQRERVVGGLPDQRHRGCEADMSAGPDTRHTNTLERTIEALAAGLGNGIGWLAQHGVLFLVYGLVWAAVGAGLVLSEATVSEAWTVIGSQNLVVQAVLWLLLLPAMLGLWIWHTDWPTLVRAGLVIGLAGWNLLVFLPRRAAAPTSSGGDEVAMGR